MALSKKLRNCFIFKTHLQCSSISKSCKMLQNNRLYKKTLNQSSLKCFITTLITIYNNNNNNNNNIQIFVIFHLDYGDTFDDMPNNRNFSQQIRKSLV